MDESQIKEKHGSLKKLFSPGSREAIDSGCTCPVMDNNKGAGAYLDPDGKPVFWFDKDCRMHGKAKEIDPKTLLKEMG